MTDEYILKKFRGNPPSLIIHLHPTHFRFDQQEGSFSYKSPMKMVLEHIRQRTVPHDLLDFMQDVPFYDGCMIVQIHDHKSIAPSQSPTRTTTEPGKTVPFSVHNHNAYLTPSPYVPYPTQNTEAKKEAEVDDKTKTAEQKDKENMPAPTLPGDSHRNKSNSPPKKPKVTTVVLHPTPLSNHVDLAIKASEAYTSPDDRRGSRQDVNGVPLSGTVPPTPTTGVPQTPQLNMAPPAKRVKRARAELDISNVYNFESHVTLARTAELKLDPVVNAAESAALLASLAHPMHSEQPPAPKTRKRTVAEMAADEALAADQERFMLVLDERLASNTTGAPGGANPANGDGPAGVSFEPRFERFKTLENIKASHEENKRQEKLRREEAERKQRVEQERNKLEENNKRAAEEKNRTATAAMQQAHQQQQQQAQMQELARRRMAQQAQQPHQNMPAQVQVPHAHPQANGIVTNGMNSQPQRFHQQQVSQAQMSSPIVRNGTPHSNSSPTVNNMGNAPMQHSTSSMGGSPARPPSVVQQPHNSMGAPGSQGMAPQRSQQSHAGTPRMPNSTPNVQVSTPLNRQMSQTPRISQGSPLQGPMVQSPQVPMMNGQPMQMTAQQMQQVMAQQRMQQMMRNQNGQNMVMMNGHPMNQAQAMQAQAQAAAIRAQQGNPMAAQAQVYAQRLAQMGQAGAGMPPNMNQNFMNGNAGMGNNPQMNVQQMQRLQQMQMLQQQQHAQAAQQQQLHQQQQQQHPDQQQALVREQMMQRQVAQMANQLYVQQRQVMTAQYPNGLPPDIDQQLKQRCTAAARQQFEATYRARQQMQQAQRMNGMQNGGGM